MLVLTVVGSGIWGFVAVRTGVPNMLIGIGALAIAAIVFVRMFGNKNSHDSN